MTTANQRSARTFPVEEFLQSLTAQLDRAQDMLALKVRAGRPLTWALKDLSLDLQVFVEVDNAGRVMLRSASAGESGASTLHINLTSITRPMVEENTFAFQDDQDPRSIDELRGAANLDEADRRKLDLLGVRTVGQLQRLSQETDHKAVESMIGLPVNRLRAALAAAARPTVAGQEVVRHPDGDLLRIHGANLADGLGTEVRLAGEPVEVIEARRNELLVRPLSHHQEGQVEVLVKGDRATGYFRLPPRPGRNGDGNGNGGEGHP